jgi:hypothetical protein
MQEKYSNMQGENDTLLFLNFDPNTVIWVRRNKFVINISICAMYRMFN